MSGPHRGEPDLADLVPAGPIGRVLADATGDPRWHDLSARLIAGGKSNLTFELTGRAGAAVLRRPPTGELLPTAHDMVREARVQRALAGTAVPVPRILAEDNGTAFGVPFYVMSRVEGPVVRDRLPVGVADTPRDRQALGEALVDVLADLHAVDPVAVGLSDFGRPEGFLARQVARWRRQWEASRDDDVPAVDALADALAARVPPSPAPTIVHGDYRLDNCVLTAGAPPGIAAVLDWEMSTLGDPLTDVGLLLFYWREAGEAHRLLTPGVTDLPGFPTRSQLAARYVARTGRDLGDLAFYEGFAHFKFAVIAQGIASRVRAGAMAGQDFGDLRGEVREIADAGLTMMSTTR